MAWQKSLWIFLACFIILSSLLASNIEANEEDLFNDMDYRIRCSGMFDKKSIPNGDDPSIQLRFYVDSIQTAATIIYEWSDREKIGVISREGDSIYICDENAINEGYCSREDFDKILYNNETNLPVIRHTFDPAGEGSSRPIVYEVTKTGYYCAAALPVPLNQTDYFRVTVEWRNPYGKLPASDYPKLPFYGTLSLTYLAIGLIWMTLSILHWRDILPVQNYISGVVFFLMVEMAFNWGYWENYNKNGSSSAILLCLVAILNAGRNSISFFMLLIVCMGYGVVKPTLGSTMIKCKALAAAHFVFGVIYAGGTLTLNPDTGNPLVLLVIFPLALTMTTFYIWTLQSINNTLQTLEIRKQNVKSLMYKRLYRLLMFSVTVLGVFFFINMFNYIHREDPDWIPTYWRWRWFLLDGWLNILYLIVFVVILVIWRPTKNNKRFAMSEELAQYDEDYDSEVRAMDNLGYDNLKYNRGDGERTSAEHDELDRLNNDESTIFDIGDIDDDESYTDGNTPRNSTSNNNKRGEDDKNITIIDTTEKSVKLDSIEEEKGTINDGEKEELTKINQ